MYLTDYTNTVTDAMIKNVVLSEPMTGFAEIKATDFYLVGYSVIERLSWTTDETAAS